MRRNSGSRAFPWGSVLAAVRGGDFEAGLEAVLAAAKASAPAQVVLGTRLDPCQTLRAEDARIRRWRAAARPRLRRVFESADASARGAAEYWALRAAAAFLLLRDEEAFSHCEEAARLDAGWAWGRLWRARVRGRLLIARRESRLLEQVAPLMPEYRAVLADFAAAVSLDPKNREAYAWRADFLIAMDQEKPAFPDLERTLELAPDYAWALVARADAFSEFHRSREALADCKTLLKKFPDAGWAYAFRGRERGKAGLFGPASEDLKKALRMAPDLAEVNAWLGEAARKRGDYRCAMAWVDRALAAEPSNPNALLWKARLLNARRRPKEALGCLGRLERSKTPLDEHFYLLRGEALLKTGRFQEAAADFDLAFPSSPNTLWSPLMKGGVEGSGTALYEDMDALLKRHPRSPWALAFHGWLWEQRGQKDAAGLEELDAALSAAPEHGWARAWRARCRFKRGLAREAFQDMDLCLARNRDYAVFWGWSGVLRLEAGDLGRAEHDLSRALRLGPGLGGFYAYRGRVRHLSGDHVNGLADLEEGLLRGPHVAEWFAWRQEAEDAAARSERGLAQA